MSNLFTIYDSNDVSVIFTSEEVGDTGTIQPFYTIEIGSEKSASGDIKQQIRAGKRFNKAYSLSLSESKYIDLINLVTNQANDYFIEYVTVPCLLSGDSEISTTNNFKISIQLSDPTATVGNPIVYKVPMTIASVELL